jgi:hypothetical protein
MGDSHGFDARAAQILDAALERDGGTASATDRLEALAYRAELAVRLDDSAGGARTLAQARSIALSEAERDAFAETLASFDDLEASLSGPSS